MVMIAGLGFSIGLVMALTGAGGGVLAVPLLMFAVGLSIQQAAPIALMSVALAATLGALLALRIGELRYKAAALMGGMGLLTAPAGLWLSHQSDPKILSGLFALVLLWVAKNAIFSKLDPNKVELDTPDERQKSPLPCIRSESTGKFIWTLECARALSFAGMVAGFLSGLLGVGGGFILVPALQRFTNLNIQSTTATALGVIAIVSSFGAITGMGRGQFNGEIAWVFAGTALLGMLLGRIFAAKVSARLSKQAFGLLCLGVAGLMLGKAF